MTKLEISLSKKPQRSTASFRAVSVRERVLRWLLGRKAKYLFIVPGDDVAEVSIVKKGDDRREQGRRIEMRDSYAR